MTVKTIMKIEVRGFTAYVDWDCVKKQYVATLNPLSCPTEFYGKTEVELVDNFYRAIKMHEALSEKAFEYAEKLLESENG